MLLLFANPSRSGGFCVVDDFPRNVDFQIYCYTAAGNAAGTLYGLLWLLLAGKVDLANRLATAKAECLAWQSEAAALRERANVAERAVKPLRDQLHTAKRMLKELSR